MCKETIVEAVAEIGSAAYERIATLEAKLHEMLADAARLDFLDGNIQMQMGWRVGKAPAGNLSVQSVIQPSGATSIRDAIDAAMKTNGGHK